jgi:hypothetical protein
MVLSVRLLGSSQTSDDVVREIFFGSVTKTRYVSLVVLTLVLLTLVSAGTLRRRWASERQEMKRIAAEKSKLQSKLLGNRLNQTGKRIAANPPEGGGAIEREEDTEEPVEASAANGSKKMVLR